MTSICIQGLKYSCIYWRTMSWLQGGSFLWKLNPILVKGRAQHGPPHLQSWSLGRGGRLSPWGIEKVVPCFQRRLSWGCASAAEGLASVCEALSSISSRATWQLSRCRLLCLSVSKQIWKQPIQFSMSAGEKGMTHVGYRRGSYAG